MANADVATGFVSSEICKTQGRIFEKAADYRFDFRNFVEKYMNSEFCEKEMDADFSMYQLEKPDVCIEALDEEIAVNPFSEKVVPDQAYNIGYLYRLGWYITGLKSCELLKRFSVDYMLEITKDALPYEMGGMNQKILEYKHCLYQIFINAQAENID